MSLCPLHLHGLRDCEQSILPLNVTTDGAVDVEFAAAVAAAVAVVAAAAVAVVELQRLLLLPLAPVVAVAAVVDAVELNDAIDVTLNSTLQVEVEVLARVQRLLQLLLPLPPPAVAADRVYLLMLVTLFDDSLMVDLMKREHLEMASSVAEVDETDAHHPMDVRLLLLRVCASVLSLCRVREEEKTKQPEDDH